MACGRENVDIWHPFRVRLVYLGEFTGGLRCAATSGYCLATLRVVQVQPQDLWGNRNKANRQRLRRRSSELAKEQEKVNPEGS